MKDLQEYLNESLTEARQSDTLKEFSKWMTNNTQIKKLAVNVGEPENVKKFIKQDMLPWLEDIWTDTVADAEEQAGTDDMIEVYAYAEEIFFPYVYGLLGDGSMVDEFGDKWDGTLNIEEFAKNLATIWEYVK